MCLETPWCVQYNITLGFTMPTPLVLNVPAALEKQTSGFVIIDDLFSAGEPSSVMCTFNIRVFQSATKPIPQLSTTRNRQSLPLSSFCSQTPNFCELPSASRWGRQTPRSPAELCQSTAPSPTRCRRLCSFLLMQPFPTFRAPSALKGTLFVLELECSLWR